ncbi:MAG: hypothetical protein IPK04_10190 [Bdellovibrionales bacterium]|nr:hypothetical protein [Bdellovibrionales bacterium]
MVNQVVYLAFESEALEKLSNQQDLYAPMMTRVLRSQFLKSRNTQIDAEIELDWDDQSVRFDVEIVSRTSPQLLEMKATKFKKLEGMNPQLIVVPYLSESVVNILKENRLSGLDLNGNYYIITPRLLAIRLDRKNEYRESATIRKIYAGTSSVVCRYLLTSQNTNLGVKDIAESIRKMGCEITEPTVSKVIKRLEEELILSRTEKGFKLLQRDKLLENLKNGYSEPKIVEQRRLKVPGGPLEFIRQSVGLKQKWCLSGTSSANRYTVATFPQAYEVYINEIPKEWLQWEDNRFFNFVYKKTSSDFVYFDRQESDGLYFCSKLQTYIELARGDKREKETGEPLRSEILE